MGEIEAHPSAVARKSVFVISPIGSPNSEINKKANLALNYIFKKAFDSSEWNVSRADDGDSPDSIGHHVIRSIVESDLIIADLTDHNPNVFYELAVAHGYRKPVVHLITDGQSIPFDLTDQRTISYDLTDPSSVDSAIRKLRASSVSAMKSPEDLITPLSSFDSFDTLRRELGGNSQAKALADVLEEVSTRLTNLEGRSRTTERAKTSENLARWVKKKEYEKTLEKINNLSPREKVLMELAAEGHTFEKMGTMLNVSPESVAEGVMKLMNKLDIDSSSEFRILLDLQEML